MYVKLTKLYDNTFKAVKVKSIKIITTNFVMVFHQKFKLSMFQMFKKIKKKFVYFFENVIPPVHL